MKIEILIYKLSGTQVEELNDILDIRDQNEFESKWLELNNQLKDIESNYDTKPDFIQLSEATGGHEICSYIVEDFELIEKARVASISTPFLDFLVSRYKKGEVPH